MLSSVNNTIITLPICLQLNLEIALVIPLLNERKIETSNSVALGLNARVTTTPLKVPRTARAVP